MMNKVLIIVGIVLISTCEANWRSLIPPRQDPNAQEIKAIFNVCENSTFCNIVVAYTIGDIYTINMIDFSVEQYHDSQNTPEGWSSPIVGIVYTQDQNQLIVSIDSGELWSINIAAQDPTTVWTGYQPDGVSVGAPIMMPLDSVQSTDILMVTSTAQLVQVDPAYQLSSVLDNSMTTTGAMPTVAIYTDCHQAPYESQPLVFTGYSDGSITCLDIGSGNVWVPFTDTYPTNGITKLLNYRSNGVLIIIGFGHFTAWYNFDTGFASTLPLFNIRDAVIVADKHLNDWLYAVDQQGVVTKTLLSSFANGDPSQARVITVQNPDPLHNENQVIQLQVNWAMISPTTGIQAQLVPTIITVSKLGTVSILDTFFNDWNIIANPSEVGESLIEITSMMVVTQHRDYQDDTIQHVLVTTAAGEVLFQDIPEIELTKGVPSLAAEKNVVYQDDYAKKRPRRLGDGKLHDTLTTSTLSWDQLTSLVNNNAEIYVTLKSATGTEIKYQVVGYDTSTHPDRFDQQKLIMVSADGNGFFDDVCCFFEDLWHFYQDNEETINFAFELLEAVI